MPSSVDAQILLGPAAGLHVTSYRYSEPSTFTRYRSNKMDVKMLDLQAGAVVDIPVISRLHLQSGLLFTTNSYKYMGMPVYFGVYSNYYNIRSLELPISFTLHTGIKDKSHFFFSAGGFLAYNVSGRRHIMNGWIDVPCSNCGAMGTKSVQVPEIEERLKFGNEEGAYYRRMGGGLNANIGYQHKSGVFARIHYQERLINNLKYEPGITRLTSSNYGLTVGYFFNTKGRMARNDEEKTK